MSTPDDQDFTKSYPEFPIVLIHGNLHKLTYCLLVLYMGSLSSIGQIYDTREEPVHFWPQSCNVKNLTLSDHPEVQ